MKKTKFIYLFILILFIINFFSIYCFALETPNIDSEAALLIEENTGKVLYEKNAHKRMFPASTTKILTAILVLENCKLDDIVTVSSNALSSIPDGYVTANLRVGEEFYVEDLLYGLMIKSANDIAVVLAEHVGGSVENFSEMMNKKAKEIGCEDTHFVNPNGIHDENHYCTGYDLYLMASYGMKNETFRKLVSTTSYTLPTTNKYFEKDRSFSSTNQLISNTSSRYYYKDCIGVKTGYTKQAGDCLVSAAQKNGLYLFSVILNGRTLENNIDSRYNDTINLFNYGFDNFAFTEIKKENDIINTIEVNRATEESKNLDLKIKDSITVFSQKDIDINEISPEINLKENIQAPINNGDVVGTIKYVIDDTEYSSELIANSDVYRRTDYSTYIILVGIFLLIFSIIIFPRKKKKTRKRRRK